MVVKFFLLIFLPLVLALILSIITMRILTHEPLRPTQVDFVCVEPQNGHDEVLVEWVIHDDSLIGKKSVVFETNLCNRYRCVNRKSIVTLQNMPGNLSESDLTCPFADEDVISVEMFEKLKTLDHKSALIADFGDKYRTPESFKVSNILVNGSLHTCDYATNISSKDLSPILASIQSVKPPQFLLIGAIVVTTLSGIACFIILVLCLWRKCCMRQQTNFMESNDWLVRVMITWPVIDDTIPALAEKMPIPDVVVDRDKIVSMRSIRNETAETETYSFPFDPRWEKDRDLLTLGMTLGIGAFGKTLVAEAKWPNEFSETPTPTFTVAIKMLKNSFHCDELKSLVCEMAIIKMLGYNEHIVNLLGCCTIKGSPLFIYEYAEMGNLKTYLRTLNAGNGQKRLTFSDQITFACQIAKGMQFLAGKKCVHRGLSARKILVTSELKLKIYDYVSYHVMPDTDYHAWMIRRSPAVIRWMSPESISDRIFNVKSDVWSFGIVLWEIMSCGADPYPGIGDEGDELQKAICSGYQIEKPENCTDQIYKVMESCWSFHPFNRPTFDNLVDIFNKLQSTDDSFLRPKARSEVAFSRLSSVYFDEMPPDDEFVF